MNRIKKQFDESVQYLGTISKNNALKDKPLALGFIKLSCYSKSKGAFNQFIAFTPNTYFYNCTIKDLKKGASVCFLYKDTIRGLFATVVRLKK